MNDEKTNKSIKCNVTNCKHIDEDNEHCCLDSIKVSCCCDGCDCTDKDETICDSFKEKKIE